MDGMLSRTTGAADLLEVISEAIVGVVERSNHGRLELLPISPNAPSHRRSVLNAAKERVRYRPRECGDATRLRNNLHLYRTGRFVGCGPECRGCFMEREPVAHELTNAHASG